MKEKIIEYGKKYGIVAVIVLALLISFLMYEKPIETVIDSSSAVTTTETVSEFIYVDIKGEVYNPGVYKVKAGTRLYSIISLAGGFTNEANNIGINLSSIMSDEDVVVIPSIHDVIAIPDDIINNPDDNLININTASSIELQELPGIGPSTAEKIIEHRETNGDFVLIEDIMNVTGIGTATFNEIKDLIKV